MTVKLLRAACGWIFSSILLLLAMPAGAAPLSPDVALGLGWLQAQVQVDGVLASEGASIANPLQARSEALYTLKLLGAPAATLQALQIALGNDQDLSTEYMARRAWALSFGGVPQPALIEQLQLRQNPDGGYGGDGGYASQPQDTAWMLLAQRASGAAYTAAVANAMKFLDAAKAADGSFAVNRQPSRYATLKALLAAAAWSSQAGTATITAPAQQWLLAQRNPAGHYGNAFDNALALWALTTQTADPAVLQPVIDAIKAEQLANGSWNNDPYLTALALRSLFLVTYKPAPPDAGIVRGSVADQGSGAMLAGVTVQVLAGGQGVASSDAQGGFTLSGVAPGTVNLRFSLLGYAVRDVSITLATGQNLNIGVVRLAPATLTASLSGVVKDQNGNPLANATVAVGTASALSSAAGVYQIDNLSPGAATISAAAAGYQGVTANVTLAAGASYIFSPRLLLANAPPPSSTSISGIVIDSVSKKPLAGALVQLGSASQTTGATGAFSFTTSAGSFVLTISANGYQGYAASGVSVPGINAVGNLGLTPLPSSSTLSGVVSDIVSGAPLKGATVAVQGQGAPVLSGADGKYSIAGLSGTSFTLNASASGYLSQTMQIALTQAGAASVDVKLQPQGAASGDLSFLKVATGQPDYPATGTIPLELALANNASANASVTVSALVLNEQGNVVYEYLGSPVIGWQGLTYGNNALIVAANSTLELSLHWNTLRLPAGSYRIQARALDDQGRAVAEGATGFTVRAAAVVAGGVLADPPLAQAGAKTPVTLSGDLANTGNLNLPAGEVQLKVILDAPEVNNNTQAQVTLKAFAAGSPMKSANKLKPDGQGNLLTVNSDGRVIRIDSAGVQSIVATLPAQSNYTDLAADAAGNIWVVYRYNKLYRITPQGAVSTFSTTRLSEIFGLDVNANGLLLAGRFIGVENGKSISNDSRLVQRDGAGIETVLAHNGLASPVAMVKDDSGNYVVSNANDGTLAKVSAADGQIMPFVSGLVTPQGIARDSAGNFYVADAGNNTVAKVTPAGQVSTWASGFKQPYDVAFDGGGTLYVSNAADDSISRVRPDGSVQLFAKGLAYAPQGMKYDAAGNLWILNGDDTLRMKDTQDNVTVVATGLSTPRGLAFAANGDVLVAELGSGRITRVSNGVKSTFASGLATPYGVAVADNGEVHVTEQGGNRISRYDAAGVKLGVTESLLVSPALLRTAPNGDVYVKNSSSLALYTGGQLRTALKSFSYSWWTPDTVAGGLVAINSNSVVRVSAAGVVTTVKSGMAFSPRAIALDAAGNIILNDYSNRKVYKLDGSGVVSELSTLPAYTYTADASDLQSDAAGNLLVRTGNGFYRMADTGALTQFTPAVSDIRGWNAGRAGEIVVWNTLKTYRVDTLTGAATELLSRGTSTTAAGLVSSAALDAAGNLYLLDTSAQRFSAYAAGGALLADISGFVTPGDIVWTGSEMRFVDSGDRFYGYTADGYPAKKAGSLPAKYLAQSGSDTYGSAGTTNINKWTGSGASGYDVWTSVGGFALSGLAARGDGGFAVGLNAENRVLVLNAAKAVTQDYAGLRTPQGLAFDSAGRLYVANYAINTIVRFNSLDSPVATVFAKDNSPNNLAFDATGQLLVTRGSSVDRISPAGAVTALTSGATYAGLVVDSGAVLALNRSASQMVKLRSSGSAYVWDVFASGLATPVALRAAPNGDVLVLNQGNNTLVKYSGGQVDVLAPVATGMNALDLGADGTATVAGNSAAVSRVAPDGSVTDLPVGSLANLWSLVGVVDGGNSRLYLLSNDAASLGVLYQLDVAQPVLPPAAGTVVYQASRPMAELAADGSYQQFNFGTWIPPYGGDFRIEMARAGVDGTATNFLHVGPNAQSQLSAASSTVPPGDSQLAMCLDLKGADFTSISRVEMSQVRQVSKSLTPRGMAADRAGNLYVTDNSSLYRTNAAGQNTLIASGMALAFGLATDSQENFYVASRNAATGRYEALRISPQGVKTVVADLGVTSANGVQVNSKDEILVGTTGKLLKVSQQGGLSTVSVNGFPQPRGIAVDGRDNVYVQNESHYVAMVKPDGASSSIFSKGDGTIDPYFEGDGYPNIAADCADNFYIAPYQWAKINQNGEEYSLAQVVPRTGRIALLFDARKIAPNLGDIDYLAFDRFGNRLLMWNDNDQSIWQVPVTCGAISVDAHLLAKAGQALSGASKPPSAVVPRADGRTEYVWSLRDVTSQGAQVCFSANQSGVQLGEQRSALDSGFISFQNTFVAGDVQVPLAVPVVRAANVVNLGASTDKAEYVAGEVARVAASLTNANAAPTAGDLRIDILDASKALVGTVTQQAVSMAAGETLQVAGIYNAGQILPGVYTAQAVLSNNGVPQASALVSFRVLADASQAAAKTTLALDKQNYAPSERVTIASRVQAQSANVVMDNLALDVQVFDGANATLFSKTYAIIQLAPGATLNFSAPYKLANAAAGSYRVEQNLRDADGRVLDHQSAAYTVAASADSGYGLTGSIAALPKQVHLGDSLAFTFQVSNSGNSVLADLPLKVAIVNPALAQVVAEFPYSGGTLAVGAGYAGAGNWTAAGSAGTTLAAVLSANVGGKTITLAQDSLALLAPLTAPVKLDIKQTLANGSRVLVLVSCDDGDDDATGADGKPAACTTDRVRTIDRALIDLGAPHTITTSELAFQQALRSGLYNTYWISGKEDKLHGTVTSEIREAAFGGDGLLVDGVHDNRNQVFDAVTGVRYRGKIGETDLPVNLNGPLFEVQRLGTAGRAMKPDLVGSTAHALFDGNNPQAHGPAIIGNSYGAGRSMLFAFDLASSLQSQNGWLPVLGASLHALLPAQAAVLAPGSVMPLRTSIANLADPVQLDVRTLLPAGAVYLDSTPAGRYEADLNRVGWTLALSAAQSQDLYLNLRAPSASGQVSLSTTVSSVLNGVATPYGDPLLQVLTVTTASQTATATQAGLAALTVSNKERKARDAAVAALSSAMASFSLNTAAGYEAAIGSLLSATDQLSSLSADTTAVHLGLDRILREAQWRWSQFPAQP